MNVKTLIVFIMRSLVAPSHATHSSGLASVAKVTSKPGWLIGFLVVGLWLAGGAAAVRGQSALDGFDPNANSTVNVVVVQPDGKILIGGDFTTLSPNGGAAVTRNRIARLNPDGTLDTAFNPDASQSVNTIAVQADGKILVGGAFTAALVLCVSAPASADEVDDYIASHLRQLHIPGVSLAVVRDGQIIKAKGYGVANVEWNAPATKDTVYEIGSMTKQFTATAIMMLVEEGKVSLDDSVRKFFPAAPETWSRITIRHLLNHTSGIQNHVALPEFLKVFQTNLKFQPSLTRDELIKLFFKLPLEFKPGETWAYDNTGYYLLGLVVEQASGKSYWQFLDERIFKPLGMAASRNTDPRPIIPNRASGYEWQNNVFENRSVLTPFVAFSAGALLSNVEDLARWDAALYTEKLLKRSSLDQMWTAARTKDGAAAPFGYGFGWFIDSYHGHRIVQHSGGTMGFSSAIYRFVDDKLTVSILTNHADRIVDQLAIDIAGIYVPALRRPQGTSDPDPKTSLVLKGVLSSLLNGKHEPASFTPAMRVFLSTATGKVIWKWFACHGELKSFTFSDREDVGNTRVFRYKVVLGEDDYWVSFMTEEGGRVARVCFW